MTLPAPDANGRHAFPDGSFLLRSGERWCAFAEGFVLLDDNGRVRYFPSASEAAGAVGFEIEEDDEIERRPDGRWF